MPNCIATNSGMKTRLRRQYRARKQTADSSDSRAAARAWYCLSMTVAHFEPVPMLRPLCRPHRRRVFRSDARRVVWPDWRFESRFMPAHRRRVDRPRRHCARKVAVRRRSANPSQRWRVERPSGIGRQRRSPRLEWDSVRGRSEFRSHNAFPHEVRRPRHNPAVAASDQQALPRRRQWRGRSQQWGAGQHPRLDPDPRNGVYTSSREDLPCHYCDGAGNLAVHETIDDAHIQSHRRIEAANVTFAHEINGPVDFARPQREPSDAGAKAKRHAPIIPADKADQRWREDWTRRERPWYPVPAVVDKRPATVMERREPPRFDVHPRPAIRFEPEPIAGAIRRPTRRYRIRRPCVSVVGKYRPTAVSVKIFVTDHLARDISRGDTLFFAARALIRPSLEIIDRLRGRKFVDWVGGVGDVSLLIGGNVKGQVADRNFRLPAPRDDGRVPGLVHFQTVIARL